MKGVPKIQQTKVPSVEQAENINVIHEKDMVLEKKYRIDTRSSRKTSGPKTLASETWAGTLKIS